MEMRGLCNLASQFCERASDSYVVVTTPTSSLREPGAESQGGWPAFSPALSQNKSMASEGKLVTLLPPLRLWQFRVVSDAHSPDVGGVGRSTSIAAGSLTEITTKLALGFLHLALRLVLEPKLVDGHTSPERG